MELLAIKAAHVDMRLRVTTHIMSLLPVSFDLAQDPLGVEGDRLIYDDFRELDLRAIVNQLRHTDSLKYIPLTSKTITQNSFTHHILIRGALPLSRIDQQRHIHYVSCTKDGALHWIAGMCCLYFPNPNDRSTGQIAVALLPIARRRGVGKEAIRMITKFAFDILRVRRIVAPIMCPILPDHTPEEKEQVILETKRLCWVFERYGFRFEGVSRGEVRDLHETSVWHDVHRMSMLDTEFLAIQMDELFPHRPSTSALESSSPWESMTRRHDEEKKQMQLWAKNPTSTVADDEEYYDDNSDECEDPEDFDD